MDRGRGQYDVMYVTVNGKQMERCMMPNYTPIHARTQHNDDNENHKGIRRIKSSKYGISKTWSVACIFKISFMEALVKVKQKSTILSNISILFSFVNFSLFAPKRCSLHLRYLMVLIVIMFTQNIVCQCSLCSLPRAAHIAWYWLLQGPITK